MDNLLHDEIKFAIVKLLQEKMVEAFPEIKDHDLLTEKGLYRFLVLPPSRDMGHLAFGLFPFSKILKKAPAQLASSLAELDWSQPWIKQVKSQGPYLNFVIMNYFWAEHVLTPILENRYFKKKLFSNPPKTMMEYSQPNTHKELHVGHMRNLALGHSLVLMHRYCGYDILSTTFPGDVGTHVAKCLWYLKNHNKEAVPEHNKGAWLGRIYSKATLKLEDEKETPELFEKNKQELTLILQQLEKKDGEFYQLWKETRQWSIALMKEIYDWADVTFDKWYWESEVDSASLKYAKELYNQGLLVESEGAIGMDLSEDKLGFCLLIKSDGNGLYATKDLELARRKFAEYKIDKSIYVVDKRQSRHFAQVFKVLEKVGWPQAKNCHHLGYDFVELPDGPMSSRKGNIVPIQELIDQMTLLLRKDHLHRYENIWSEERISEVANQVALGAINYGMLRMDPNKKIVFDMKEWLKLDGESGPYLQYVHARICSLIEKLQSEQRPSTDQKIDWQLLTHDLEYALMVKLGQFNTVVASACEQYKPSHLCTYLYELGKLFNSFYAECSVGKAQTDELKWARLALCESIGKVIARGLQLLGIPAPQQM